VIGVFVISGTDLYREGLCEILAKRLEINVVGSAAGASGGIEGIAGVPSMPDIVLLDMAGPGGVAEARELLGALPDLRVVAITLPALEPNVIECAEAGVVGFLTTEASLDQLVAAIEAAARGEVLCSPSMAADLVRHVGALARDRPRRAGTATERLTAREREVVRLIDAGLSNKQIAQRLCVELPTVKNHVHHILAKLGVQRRYEAAACFRSQLS
jgi:two-component system, NarL family, nitrate/nitrite response regulator NarL